MQVQPIIEGRFFWPSAKTKRKKIYEKRGDETEILSQLIRKANGIGLAVEGRCLRKSSLVIANSDENARPTEISAVSAISAVNQLLCKSVKIRG